MSCSICLETSVHPITISCHHTFCYRCIFHWIDQASSTKPTCPVCRTPIQEQANMINRLTRSMTEYRREKVFIAALLEKLYRWRALDVRRDIKRTYRKKLDLLHEFFQLIYKNTWLMGRKHFFFFQQVLKEKINTLEREGYKEAPVWKYKLREHLVKIVV